MMRQLLNRLPGARFARAEDGNSTMEFVLWVPFMMFFLASMVESSMFMTRWMLLDRALDIAVRDLRLGTNAAPSFDDFRQSVCDNARLPDCMNSLQIELVPLAPGTWDGLTGTPNCIDRSATIDPMDGTSYTPGTPNQMVAVRACALMEPMFTQVGLGLLLPKDTNGEYQVLAFSAYVQEP